MNRSLTNNLSNGLKTHACYYDECKRQEYAQLRSLRFHPIRNHNRAAHRF